MVSMIGCSRGSCLVRCSLCRALRTHRGRLRNVALALSQVDCVSKYTHDRSTDLDPGVTAMLVRDILGLLARMGRYGLECRRWVGPGILAGGIVTRHLCLYRYRRDLREEVIGFQLWICVPKSCVIVWDRDGSLRGKIVRRGKQIEMIV